MIFPTHKFSIQSRETVRDPVLLSVARSGAPKSRRLYQRPRRAFALMLKGLTNEEKATVEIFLAANRMTAFQIEWCGVPDYGGALLLPTTSEHFQYPSGILPHDSSFTIETNIWLARYNAWWHCIYGFGGWGLDVWSWPGEWDITEYGRPYFNRGSYFLNNDPAQGGPSPNVPGFYYDHWADTAIPLRKWVHAAISFDVVTDEVRFFYQGRPDGSGDNSLAGVVQPIPPDTEILLGSWGSYGGRDSMMLDELRFWNYCRTPEEIAANMNVAMAGDEPGLLACYHFDELSGTTAHDATAGARDLIFYPDAFYPGEPGIVPGEPLQWMKLGPVGAKPDTLYSVIEEEGVRNWSKEEGRWEVSLPVLEA